MSGKDAIRFVLDDEIVELADVEPTRTVLQYLREDCGRKGSKEGCAEGDCGACTVVVAEPDGRMQAVNSCIRFLPTLDGRQLFTVESLADGDDLHPAQVAMIREHGSQCGFCTPGFVMSMVALHKNQPNPTRQEIDNALAGNLCRCTGYRPIVAAARSMYAIDGREIEANTDLLSSVQRQSMLFLQCNGRRFFAPRDVDELAAVLEENPAATLLAGGTDVGLWVTKQYRDLDCIVYTGNVRELLELKVAGEHIEIGAAVSLSDAMLPIVKHYPGLDELFRRFASPPIRNAGTLGGNIANGSPIGDSMAALMVVGTTLKLRRGDDERDVALDAFYHDYMQNDLGDGEFLTGIRVPLPMGDAIVRSHKWSKRFDQDISAVCSAYRLELDGDTVKSFRMACGGLAATVRRATATERVLTGQRWDAASVELACEALAEDFAPISDMRAGADDRLLAVRNLLRRLHAESEDPQLQTVYEYGRAG